MAVDTFGIDKEFLSDLLREVGDGRTQLPEFQRGWVWPDRNISSLLASISLGYPVGTLMMLKTGGDVRFKQRAVEGATPAAGVEPERLILDGQQRMTSLFQALKLGLPLKTQDVRKRPVSGWFYIDMRQALDPSGDREEAIRFLPADRIVRNFRGEVIKDYSTPDREYEAHLFPLAKVFDHEDWMMGFQEHWGYAQDKMKLWNAFQSTIIKRFDTYQFPIIELDKGVPRQAVCQVFEKVNTGGVTLTVFELLTATYAADEFDLREHWKECRKEWSGPEYRILREVSNTDFLQAITLLATDARRDAGRKNGVEEDRLPRIGCKRADMLGLTLPEYERFAPMIVNGLKAAARFLHRQYIFDTRFLPYGTQLIPLAAIFAVLGTDAENAGAQQKLARWYWCGVFGELYGGTTETRFSRDLPDVAAWIRGSGTEPRTVVEAQFVPGRLLTLRTRNSAAYKGIYALLMKAGAQDWRTGEASTITNYFDDAIDIHHIFPKAWCETQKIDSKIYNAIVNKTPLTARTNRVIGGRAPSEYLSRLANSAGVDDTTIDAHVTSHLAEPRLMREDDFDAFFQDRKRALLGEIADAMGKVIEDIEDVKSDAADTFEVDDDTDDL
ncbi:GmrSD restriction endonuclease domain-containing protein [Actinoallomurus rhizosphaericola]|uniref:GmrSD restriction endonuclease domain-containing protein n=1 Tax=Actinoallomurus rhizosphaericola TaxID=2952536 RepID=UPI002090283B|nr:DUF262 domain-containing protein [Actinoallomurus rhizosphaericola]MCO5994766.1 DUF262 domain-containing protein [Actinoallomurus rhizosphaericola]